MTLLNQLPGEERLRLAASQAASLVLITITPDGKIVDWSAGAQAMFGWTAQEAVGMPVSAIFSAEDQSQEIPSKQMAQAREQGPVHDTRWLAAKSGSRVFAESELTALRLLDDTFAGYAMIVRDATAFLRYEQSEAILSAMVNATPHMVWSADAEGRADYFNEKMLQFTGQPAQVLLGHTWTDLVYPDDREQTWQAWATANRDRTPLSIEYRFRHHSGEYRWVLCRGEPVLDEETGELIRWMGTSTDIHEQKVANEALRDARQRLEATLSAGNIGTWTWDLSAGLVYADEHVRRLFGIPGCGEQGMQPEVIFAAIHPDDVADVRASVAQAIAQRGAFSATYRILAQDGELRHVHARGKVESGGDGAALWIPGVVVDVTDLRASQEELQVREQRYRTLFNSIDEGFAIVELIFDGEGNAVDHRILEANAALSVITGLVDIEGKLSSEIHAEYASIWRETYAEVLRTGKPVERVVEVPHWGRWVSFSISRLGDESTRQIAIFLRDFTQRKQYEDDLRRREERYRALFNSIEEGFAIVELIFDAAGHAQDYRFLEVNPALARITGLQNVLGKTLREVVEEPNMDWVARYAEVARTGEAAQWTDYSQALGAWYDLSVVRVGGAGRQVALLFKDVSERRRNDEALRQLAEDLAEANRRQREFLATLAHELRNPLAPIRAGLDVLRVAARDPDKVAKLREVMTRQVNHLVHLVDDLLDLARVTSGKIELKRSTVLLGPIVQQAVESVTPLMESRRHQFSVDVAAEPIWLTADPNRVVQMLANLLTNAGKYTPEGGQVHMRVAREGAFAVIAIADNGIGIPSASLPHLFEMFSQVSEASALSDGGLGIGLNLVKRLAEKHGGQIEVASPGEGRGATFTLRLPVD